MKQKAQIVSDHAIELATLGSNDQLLLVVGKVHGHDARVESSLVGKSPGAACQVDFLNLAVTTSDE